MLTKNLTSSIHILQVTYSVPYALISSRIEALGLGQGLVITFNLNLADM